MAKAATEPGAMAKRLVRQLRRQVLGGQLPAGAKLPSVRELAGANGVGKDTANLALRWIEREGWAKRSSTYSLRVADDAPQIARAQFEHEPPTIIVFLAGTRARGLDPGIIDKLIDGFSDVFPTGSFRNLYFDLSRWVGFVNHLLEQDARLSCEIGYVLRSLPPEIYQTFATSRVPCVVTGYCDPTLNLPCVYMDAIEAGRIVGAMLCPFGRTVALCQEGLVGSEVRVIEGVRQAAAALGCPVPAPHEFHYHLPPGFDDYVRAIDRLFAERNRPAGVVTFRYEYALAVVKVAAQRGIKVPEELQVIGLHHHPVFQFTLPAITSVGNPWFDVGHMAGTLLADCLMQMPPVATRALLSPTVIKRESTHPPSAQPSTRAEMYSP